MNPKPIQQMTRGELSYEFQQVINEARKRGDTRAGIVIIGDWYRFRRVVTG